MTRRRCPPLLVGTYRPPAFGAPDMALLHLWLAAWEIFRASDYVFSFGELYAVAELALSPAMWAIMCWATGWLIFTGLAGRLHALVWAGHYLGLAMNLGLAVGMLLLALERTGGHLVASSVPIWAWSSGLALLAGGPLIVAATRAARGVRTTSTQRVTIAVAGLAVATVAFGPVWPMDGGRAVGPYLTTALLHGMLAVRMTPRPVSTVTDDTTAQDGHVPTPRG